MAAALALPHSVATLTIPALPQLALAAPPDPHPPNPPRGLQVFRQPGGAPHGARRPGGRVLGGGGGRHLAEHLRKRLTFVLTAPRCPATQVTPRVTHCRDPTPPYLGLRPPRASDHVPYPLRLAPGGHRHARAHLAAGVVLGRVIVLQPAPARQGAPQVGPTCRMCVNACVCTLTCWRACARARARARACACVCVCVCVCVCACA